MQRNGSSNNIADNFSYNYYTNTNKVQRVTGSVQQFTYDLNGNVTGDSLNHLYGFKYDYRNLITEFRRWEQISTSKGTVTNAYKINYFYDEAGNRVKKALYKWQGADPIPVEGNDANGTFNLLSVTYYVRDVSGKEIAIYTDAGSGIGLDQWNVYGLDNIGKIDPSNHRFMYLKDHLGSVRAIIDTTNTVVYAQDYDAWGYPLENRTYDAGVLTNSKYKFTAKERDKESGLNGGDGYDYFGARYYNSRIANWTSIDPLLEKHFDWSPYNYVLRNPLRLFDPDGKQVDIMIGYRSQRSELINDLNHITGMSWVREDDNSLRYEIPTSSDYQLDFGSETARNWMIQIVNSPHYSVISSKNAKTGILNGDIHFNWESMKNLKDAYEAGQYNGMPLSTYWWGMIFIHEALHKLGKDDPEIISIENNIRQELSQSYHEQFGARQSHSEFDIPEGSNEMYIPMDETSYTQAAHNIKPSANYIMYNESEKGK